MYATSSGKQHGVTGCFHCTRPGIGLLQDVEKKQLQHRPRALTEEECQFEKALVKYFMTSIARGCQVVRRRAYILSQNLWAIIMRRRLLKKIIHILDIISNDQGCLFCKSDCAFLLFKACLHE